MRRHGRGLVLALACGSVTLAGASATGTSGRDVRFIDWDVTDAANALKLFDVAFDGVRAAETLRDNSISVLSQSGGRPDILTDKLKIQIGR